MLRRRSRLWLLLGAGVAWFVGDFHATGPGWLGWFATTFAWVFLAPLVQLALAFPSGRPRTRPPRRRRPQVPGNRLIASPDAGTEGYPNRHASKTITKLLFGEKDFSSARWNNCLKPYRRHSVTAHPVRLTGRLGLWQGRRK